MGKRFYQAMTLGTPRIMGAIDTADREWNQHDMTDATMEESGLKIKQTLLGKRSYAESEISGAVLRF